MTFNADKGDSGDQVQWSAGRGSIDSSGRYTAPWILGDDWVRATSRNQPQFSDSIRINVVD